MRSRHERGWALVVVLAASIICIALGMALVANRHQAMKLSSRQQKDQLAVIDAQIQSEHAKVEVVQAIQQQVGGINITSGGSSALSSALPNAAPGSKMTDAAGSVIVPYQVTGQYGSTSASLDQSSQAVALRRLNFPPTSLTTSSTDPADPLLGVQSAQLVGVLPVQINSTVANDETVFYVGQSASTSYALREIPLSIYSLYGSGNSSISPDQLATGDAGRVYVSGSLAVSGQVVASLPLTAQGGISAPSDGSASLTVGSTAQTLGQTGATLDQQLMASGNQILTSGSQASGVQVLPTSNFGDPNNAALSGLGTQCEFQVNYTDTADASGNFSGQATVTDNGAKIPNTGTGTTFSDQLTQDSNTMNARWDLPGSNLTPPAGYMAAIDPNTGNTRLMNKETDPANQAPMQFIVLDYAHISALNPPTKQTFYIPGNPTDYALLIRDGVDSNGNGQVTNGFSVVTNLDIYVSGGLGPSSTANSPAISLITSGKVHATP